MSDPVSDPLSHQRRLAEEARDAHLRWLLDAVAVDCVVDVGANRGQFGRAVRGLGYAGRLVSLEPAAGPRRDLVETAAGDACWHVLPVALGEEDGTADLLAVDEESELGSLLPASEFGLAWKDVMGRTRREQVDVRRLDGIWEDVAAGARRVLLKLDTQGYDLAAFRGAGRLVSDADGPVVAVLSELSLVPIYEAMPTMAEQLAAYEAAGWSLAGLHPVSFDAATLRVIELDALLVRSPAEASRTA